jgi:hypothetical protein
VRASAQIGVFREESFDRPPRILNDAMLVRNPDDVPEVISAGHWLRIDRRRQPV